MLDEEELNEENNLVNEAVKIKIVILGKALVGKSALTYRFISDKFLTDHDTTIEDQYKTRVTVNGTECDLEVLDTAGQDDYQSMLDSWIDFGDCYLLVYSIDDLESFKLIKSKYDRICELKKKENFSAVIVGNKRDLPDDQRKITKTEADYLAKSLGVECLEVSALTNVNVREAFMLVVSNYIKKNKNISDKWKLGCPCF